MNNFNYKKYLAEGKLLKETNTPPNNYVKLDKKSGYWVGDVIKFTNYLSQEFEGSGEDIEAYMNDVEGFKDDHTNNITWSEEINSDIESYLRVNFSLYTHDES
jgi:hypothetical protein